MMFQLSAYLFVFASLFLTRAEPISRKELEKNYAKGLHLISLTDNSDPVWKTEAETLELIRAHINFFDVTDIYDPEKEATVALSRYASFAAIDDISIQATYASPSHQSAVTPLFKTVSVSNMQSYLGNLTAFNNRYYTSTTGVQATTWIVNTVSQIAALYPNSKATVSAFKHTWAQSSIVAKIPGSTNGPITILGAHMDSINSASPSSGRAPGADDDGSGSVNLIEAFRVLLASGFKPTTPVEFHWYAAEEVGLRGSQAIATSYKSSNVQVKAMLQFDMTAYVKPGVKETIGLMPDYVDAGLTSFVASLIDSYLLIPWATSQPCGYACSDHASWYKQSYPAALPFESLFSNSNANIHKTADTTAVSGFSWTHTLEYAKLAVAFAYELAI
ncbi:Zn-dependent exopeptidase [Crucibulum laeve]|uniref:Peptide hydrolase n=1 Tax=Crucibulum laeve TaxID=68775 RepID=A0A5C3M2F1_9AGAR|nr:Zn-dependent exopeptidase [Crucibulum laeve]